MRYHYWRLNEAFYIYELWVLVQNGTHMRHVRSITVELVDQLKIDVSND